MTDINLNCCICQDVFDEEELMILNCNHKTCLICLHGYIKNDMQKLIKCPCTQCKEYITDKVIREVLSDEEVIEYDRKIMSKVENVHQCLMPDCSVPIVYSSFNIQYDCDNCSLFNCVICKAPHKWLTCHDYSLMESAEAQTFCQKELDRAKSVFNKKLAVIRRRSLVQTDNSILLSNTEIFKCPICNSIIGKHKGITLRQCFHNICRECIKQHVLSHPDIPIPCPISPCGLLLEDRECRELLSPVERLLFERKSLNKAKPKLEKADHCRKENCINFVDIGMDVTEWVCNICHSKNCLKCDTIHTNQTCNEYRNLLVDNKDTNQIEELIRNKKLMRCPDCKTLLQKTHGCNWIKCMVCNVELCWILQMYRWGPKGRGDISGGCKCGVNARCHPQCSGCVPHS